MATQATPRAMWSGAITFGLITIPVKLYTAVREQGIDFHMLHDQDHSRLKRKMMCAAEDKEVHPEHTVKGYEIAPDQYVIIEESELEAVQPKKSRAIAIEDFVDLAKIDPVFYDRPYYLVPEETGTKPYRLLVEAMQKTQRVGIARLVMRNKEYLAAIRPLEDALVLETMHFAAEVVPIGDLQEVPRQVKSDARELKMAEQLIDSLYGDFKPEKYKDEYLQAVREMIERKAAGEKIVTAPAPKEGAARAGNLMEALQASLDRAREAAGDRGPARETRRKSSPDEAPAPRQRRAAAVSGAHKHGR